jgi:hypothetical protein
VSSVLARAAVPSLRTVTWTPIVVASAVLLALSALLRAQDAPSQAVLSLGAGAMAAAMVHALGDQAAALLAAVPVSRAARRLLRIGSAALVAVPLWLLATYLLPGAGTALAQLGALVVVGLAVATWLPFDRPVTVAAGVPLLWVALGEVLGDADGPIGRVALVWNDQPLAVAAVGALLFVLGRHR